MTNLFAAPQPQEVVVAKETRFLEQSLIHRMDQDGLRHTAVALLDLDRVTSGFRQTAKHSLWLTGNIAPIPQAPAHGLVLRLVVVLGGRLSDDCQRQQDRDADRR